eukprot:scaffold304452_cov33-Tisochrysis_lutea.AAC.5
MPLAVLSVRSASKCIASSSDVEPSSFVPIAARYNYKAHHRRERTNVIGARLAGRLPRVWRDVTCGAVGTEFIALSSSAPSLQLYGQFFVHKAAVG